MLISQFSTKDNRSGYAQGALAGGLALGGLNAATTAKSVSQEAPKQIRHVYKLSRKQGMSASKARQLAGNTYRGVMKKAVQTNALKGAAIGATAGLIGTGINNIRKKYF